MSVREPSMKVSTKPLNRVLLLAAKATAMMSLIQVGSEILKAWTRHRPFSETHFEFGALFGLPFFFLVFVIFFYFKSSSEGKLH